MIALFQLICNNISFENKNVTIATQKTNGYFWNHGVRVIPHHFYQSRYIYFPRCIYFSSSKPLVPLISHFPNVLSEKKRFGSCDSYDWIFYSWILYAIFILTQLMNYFSPNSCPPRNYAFMHQDFLEPSWLPYPVTNFHLFQCSQISFLVFQVLSFYSMFIPLNVSSVKQTNAHWCFRKEPRGPVWTLGNLCSLDIHVFTYTLPNPNWNTPKWFSWLSLFRSLVSP